LRAAAGECHRLQLLGESELCACEVREVDDHQHVLHLRVGRVRVGVRVRVRVRERAGARERARARAGAGARARARVSCTCELNIWLNCTAGMRGAEATTSCSSRRMAGSVEPTPAW
jgi:hypothetical protein